MPLEHCIANEDDEEVVDEFEYGIDDGVVLQLPLNDEINAPTIPKGALCPPRIYWFFNSELDR